MSRPFFSSPTLFAPPRASERERERGGEKEQEKEIEPEREREKADQEAALKAVKLRAHLFCHGNRRVLRLGFGI